MLVVCISSMKSLKIRPDKVILYSYSTFPFMKGYIGFHIQVSPVSTCRVITRVRL